MKKILLALSILFIILTFCGAGYVLCNRGTVNAGYATVPMVIGIAFVSLYLSKNTKSKE